MAGTTGDIIWKKLDPKTFYLYNEPPPEEGTQESPTQATTEGPANEQNIAASVAKMLEEKGQLSQLDKAMFQHDLSNMGVVEASRRAIRHYHTRQIAELHHDLMKNPDSVTRDRIQELMDSGALRIEQDGGLYSSIPLAPHTSQRILDAVRTLWTPEEEPAQDTQDFKERYEREIAQQEGEEQ